MLIVYVWKSKSNDCMYKVHLNVYKNILTSSFALHYIFVSFFENFDYNKSVTGSPYDLV